MKVVVHTLLSLLVLAPASGYAAEQLIPAGSLIQCTVSEPKLSSKNLAVGDPVLCQISHFQLYGRQVFPFGSYLVGEFKEYKDPGHFVGKGWMDLEFDRVAMPPDQEFPVEAKVIAAPGYPVDRKGRIDGKGHPVRDAVEWSIPVLWPIDLLNLPRRGPRPVLKQESRLTLKIMEDVMVPDAAASMPAAPASGPVLRQRPMSYSGTGAWMAPASDSHPLTILATRDGYTRMVTQYWFQGGSKVVYRLRNGNAYSFPIERLDLTRTIELNRERGVNFVIQSAGN